MGEIAASSSSWRKGGWAITLEEHRRRDDTVVSPPPGQGTRSTATVAATADWREQARCRIERVPVDFFFPVEGDQASLPRIVRFCDECDVQTECAQYARVNGIVWGWWGGLSPRQRQGRDDTVAEGLREREHGTYQRYKYGAFGRALGAGCRCTPCREAASAEWRKGQEAARRRRRKQRQETQR